LADVTIYAWILSRHLRIDLRAAVVNKLLDNCLSEAPKMSMGSALEVAPAASGSKAKLAGDQP
jgi:hypothetical protein